MGYLLQPGLLVIDTVSWLFLFFVLVFFPSVFLSFFLSLNFPRASLGYFLKIQLVGFFFLSLIPPRASLGYLLQAQCLGIFVVVVFFWSYSSSSVTGLLVTDTPS